MHCTECGRRLDGEGYCPVHGEGPPVMRPRMSLWREDRDDEMRYEATFEDRDDADGEEVECDD